MEDGVAAPIRTVAAGIVTAGIAIAFVQWIQGVTGQGNEELQVTVEEFHRHGVASVDDLSGSVGRIRLRVNVPRLCVVNRGSVIVSSRSCAYRSLYEYITCCALIMV